jgi:hypothetical protein
MMWITIALGALLLTTGLWFFLKGRSQKYHDLGVGLVTGAAVAVSVLALQLTVEENADQRTRDEATAAQLRAAQEKKASDEAAFRLLIATSADLTGFDPRGRSLRAYYLGGKKFVGANFVGTDLREAVLRGSDLSAAAMRNADLRKADLISANLSETILTGADLTAADLRYANLTRSAVEHVKSLSGVRVNAETCWPAGFLTDPGLKSKRDGLRPEPIMSDPSKPVPASPGHTCKGG